MNWKSSTCWNCQDSFFGILDASKKDFEIWFLLRKQVIVERNSTRLTCLGECEELSRTRLENISVLRMAVQINEFKTIIHIVWALDAARKEVEILAAK
ncbi:hypothetical protein PoB_004670600 [Plakobranchus ocellatus]|uniref:Uncharacterized protein n=1 Tax=Plakobranchus ocellatus TaxID=259542 RepID=A0AAV4BA27_9GAST|nr:hypothetical protein PoB_004670600 [Plakobranchus ocellatus]